MTWHETIDAFNWNGSLFEMEFNLMIKARNDHDDRQQSVLEMNSRDNSEIFISFLLNEQWNRRWCWWHTFNEAAKV